MSYLITGVHAATAHHPQREALGTSMQAIVRKGGNAAIRRTIDAMRPAFKRRNICAVRVYSYTNLYDEKTYRLISEEKLSHKGAVRFNFDAAYELEAAKSFNGVIFWAERAKDDTITGLHTGKTKIGTPGHNDFKMIRLSLGQLKRLLKLGENGVRVHSPRGSWAVARLYAK